MADITDHVEVTIDFQRTSINRANFGIPLICAYIDPATQPNLVETYNASTALKAMEDAGHATYSAPYLMVASLLAADPNVKQLKLARHSAHTHTVTLTVGTVAIGDVLTVTIVDQLGVSHTISHTTTTAVSATEAEAFALAIDTEMDPGLTAGDVGAVVTCTADTAGDTFFYSKWSDNLTFKDITTDFGIFSDLNAIKAYDDQWYLAAFDVTSELIWEPAGTGAAWFETVKKLGMMQTQDDDVGTTATDDVLSELKSDNRLRTIPVAVGKNPINEYGAPNWAGICLPKDPGSQTWCFKQPSGVSVSGYSTTQETNVEAKNGNHVVEVGGVTYFRHGKTSKGEWIDSIRLADWTEARIQENVMLAFVNNDKIPYNESAYSLVHGIIFAVYREGAENGGYEIEDFTFTAPDIEDQSQADQDIRKLSGIEFGGKFTGANHSVEITGRIA